MGRIRRFLLTGGNRHDIIAAEPLLLDHEGASHVLADKGYDSRDLREALLEQGKEPVIPPRSNTKAPAEYDATMYKERNLIERCFGRIKDYRRIATRFDKLARNFAAAVALVACRIWYCF